MIIETLIAARYVEITPEGLLTIVSAGIDRFSAPQFPTIAPLHVLGMIKFEPAEMGPHEIQITVVDEDGASCWDGPKLMVNAHVGEGRDPHGGYRQNIHINGMQFPKHGRFSIDLLVDRKIEQRISFHAELKKPEAEAA